MYMTTRARMSFVMEPIGPELSELSALEFENLPYLTMFTLASTNINQSSLNLVKMYMTTRAWMRYIMEPNLVKMYQGSKFPHIYSQNASQNWKMQVEILSTC